MTKQTTVVLKSDNIQNKLMPEFGDRLKSIRSAKGFSREQVANSLSCSKNALAHYEKGRPAHVDTIIEIGWTLKVSALSLLIQRAIFGKAKPEAINYFIDELKQQNKASLNKLIASNTNPTAHNSDSDTLQFSNEIFLMQNNGDRMTPKYADQDYLFINIKQTQFIENQIFMVDYELSATSDNKPQRSPFRLQKNFNNELILVSENKDYPPLVVAPHQHNTVKIIGEVVGSLNKDSVALMFNHT